MPTWQCRSRDFIFEFCPAPSLWLNLRLSTPTVSQWRLGRVSFCFVASAERKMAKKPRCVDVFLSGRVAVLLERLGETCETYGYWLWKRNWKLRYRIATPKQRWKKWTWSLSFYPIFRKHRLKNCHSTSWVNAAKCHATAWSMSLGFRLRLSCTC